jgi:hypothetical protein
MLHEYTVNNPQSFQYILTTTKVFNSYLVVLGHHNGLPCRGV